MTKKTIDELRDDHKEQVEAKVEAEVTKKTIEGLRIRELRIT